MPTVKMIESMDEDVKNTIVGEWFGLLRDLQENNFETVDDVKNYVEKLTNEYAWF